MKKNDNNFKYFLFLVIAFVAGGIITVSLLKWTPILNNTNTVITKNGTQVYEKSSLAAAVDKIYDAVVVVQGYNNDSLASTGTGFVYKTDDKYGYILTNQHVIEDMQKLVITMSNESQTDATVLGSDEYLDLAVLRTSSVFKNSTSIFGANITRRQIELFKRFPKIVYIPDSDAAGEKTVEKLKAARLGKTYILRIPKKINNIDVKDVGDLTKAGIVPQDLVDRNWLSYEKFLS